MPSNLWQILTTTYSRVVLYARWESPAYIKIGWIGTGAILNIGNL